MKLSVCIPVYNVAAYVEKCARSLFEQTHRDIEYIFVDDASPDDSIAIVERVLKDYPNRADQVTVLHHVRNRGLVAARKTALSAATGDLIAHCDSDDWVDPELFASAVAKFGLPEVDMVYFSFCRNYPERALVKESAPFDGTGPDFLRCADSMFGFNNLVNKIYRRSIALDPTVDWPDEIAIGEDLCYTSQLDFRCRRIVKLDGQYYHYRVNEGSMTMADGAARRTCRDLSKVFRVLSKALPEGRSGAVRRQLAYSILYLGVVSRSLSGDEYDHWRAEFEKAGGDYDFSSQGKWGNRAMKIARHCFPLSGPFVRLLESRIDKVL